MSRHLALVGPTATGKSALALEVAAQAGDIEIVSLDSMQVYRTMDIGTAKPTRAERLLWERLRGRARELGLQHAGLYEQLRRYYRVDPARWEVPVGQASA